MKKKLNGLKIIYNLFYWIDPVHQSRKIELQLVNNACRQFSISSEIF